MSARVACALLLMMLLTTQPAAALPATGVPLSVEQMADIERGEVVVESSHTSSSTMGDVIAVGYVSAPPSAVWHVITDYDHYARMFPNIRRSEIRAKHGNVEDHYAELIYPWPLADKWVLNRITHDPAHLRIHWHRIDGTVKEVVGSWHLIAQGRRTLVVYIVRVDPGLPFVPEWAITWGTRTIAPQIVANLRKYVVTPGP